VRYQRPNAWGWSVYLQVKPLFMVKMPILMIKGHIIEKSTFSSVR
jgi:hypothetical protein